jgi:sodium/hydrogen antiporter
MAPFALSMNMNFNGWMVFIGGLLLAMAFSSVLIQRLPISTAAIYLLVGCVIGPWGFELLRLDLGQPSPFFLRLTEIAVILSLFIGGLRLRLPLRDRAWRAAYQLASVVMVVSIAGVAVFSWWVFDLDPALALLLGAVLAPTDPVLASSVTVGQAQDHDRMRYALSGEAGLNDGAAFPFVVLALAGLQYGFDSSMLIEWGLKRLLWAIPAALALGFAMGRVVGTAAISLRTRLRDTNAPTDFLALALVALSYTAAEAIGAWGFLSVFAAGLGLRHAELSIVAAAPHPDIGVRGEEVHPPAETLVTPNKVSAEEIQQPAVAAGVLVAEVFSFGDTAERMLEVLLVVLVGVSLADHWDPRGLLLAGALFLVIRPLATRALLPGRHTSVLQRWLLGWFGIRGIGSLFYLAYAYSHGLREHQGRDIADLTLSVVAISIVLHGLTSKPLMDHYERKLNAQP